MLGSMVAMPTLDLIVAALWVGALALILVAQATYVWLSHRHWARAAREAGRLAAATRPEPARALTLLPGGRADETEDEEAHPSRPAGTDVPVEA